LQGVEAHDFFVGQHPIKYHKLVDLPEVGTRLVFVFAETGEKLVVL